MKNIEAVEKPKLSVIVASKNALANLSSCLSEILIQGKDNKTEIIVVDNSTDGTTSSIVQNFPSIRLIEAPKDKLIPELWAIGIKASNSEYVSLTTTHFVPAKNWVAETIKIHDSQQYSGVGGAIENYTSAGLTSWAIYFCRYSRYMLPFIEEVTDDFAADNASYKRSSLDHIKYAMINGFWEVFVHKEMRKEKMSLILTPNIIVYHQQSFTFAAFIVQRFLHGRQFGNTRARSISSVKRIVLILLAPLIPFIYLFRITRLVVKKKRNINKYILSLPVLLLFLISWSIGEFIGYLMKFE